ncbi:MAG: S8 family serine peptidase, partial [Rhodothermales bacterium]|nr:S8 family serine peptidase [Rhodothermales bacterium]
LLGKFSSFSNHGPYVDILAPGEDVLSLTAATNGGGAERMDGTSMSAAHVSGAAALYLAQHPSATSAQVLNALLANSKNFVTDQEPSTTTRSVWVGEATTLTIMLVASNGDSPSAQDLAKKTLFESWGHNVIVVDDGASSSVYNAAIAQSDVAYVSEESSSSNVGTKLTYAGIGVLNEEMQLTDELSLSDNRATSYEAGLVLSDASHFITEPFAGSVTLFNSAQPTFGMGGTLASGLTLLGSWSNAPSLAVLEAGAATYNVGPAAGRRVQLPFGGNDLDINSLTADGATLLRRAIEWAGTGTSSAPPTTGLVERRIASGNDDAEERLSSGDMYMDSSDLELVKDGDTDQLVGLRFTNLDIPQGATITNAYIQFKVDETNSGTTSVTFRGHDTGNATAFTTSDYNLSNRSMTGASTQWLIEPWNSVGATGSDQRTPNLSGIVQEIVSRGDWYAGNAMAFFVSGSGERTAESYNGDSSGAALLHIEYVN